MSELMEGTTPQGHSYVVWSGDDGPTGVWPGTNDCRGPAVAGVRNTVFVREPPEKWMFEAYGLREFFPTRQAAVERAERWIDDTFPSNAGSS